MNENRILFDGECTAPFVAFALILASQPVRTGSTSCEACGDKCEEHALLGLCRRCLREFENDLGEVRR